MVQRKRNQRFARDYTNSDIISYLRGVSKALGRAPTFRDLAEFPGPSPRTVVRRFRYWSEALKLAGIRPHTRQLLKGEQSFIRLNWRKMTDHQIAENLGVNFSVIRYYRMNYNLWKNRKGTAKSTYRNKALKLYGEACECCGVKMCEWHHLISKSKDPKDWVILCPTCHAVITRKLVNIRVREEISTVLYPFVKKIYSDLKI